MGSLFPTIYAHVRLHAMLRAWRKATGLMDKLETFILKHASEQLRAEFTKAEENLESVMDKVIKEVEDKTISELKERL